MHKWFVENAPIRQKLFFVFSVMAGYVAVTALVGIVAAITGSVLLSLILGTVMVAATAWTGAWMRRGIADPYVTTVVRMEALAAGDLTSPIRFTEHADCVGRMTKAMFVFQNTAIQQASSVEQQRGVVNTVSAHLSELSDGDLTTRIGAAFPSDYAALKANFNDALDKLQDLIGSVSESTAAIRTGSVQIAQASEDLARRTESNAAGLEETAASVTQMDGRLKASAAAASRNVERADQAIATVGGGRAVADEAVQAMGRVSESAKGIDSVIEGLDKIAFQTRVLAMNAAVEAGRAGDAGRGFAVVADLVSALAMRAEEEAKRARDQLTVTQTEIVTAVEAVQKVDGAFADISGDVGQVHELLATMAADNQAQAAAITEISSAIGTMDQATQQNAAMVEETSAASRNLAVEVDKLADQAARFKIDAPGKRGASKPATTVMHSLAKPPRTLPPEAIAALRLPVSSGAEAWNEF